MLSSTCCGSPRAVDTATTVPERPSRPWLESRPVARVLGLVGPTAVGKTALALALSDRLPLEVVSADSRTVYRWMDIGTAKPTLDEQRRLPHHLIDVVDPDQTYSLALYQRQARGAIERIRARGRVPLLVGGAGLYVSAVCDGLAMPEVSPDVEFRAEAGGARPQRKAGRPFKRASRSRSRECGAHRSP